MEHHPGNRCDALDLHRQLYRLARLVIQNPGAAAERAREIIAAAPERVRRVEEPPLLTEEDEHLLDLAREEAPNGIQAEDGRD